MNRTPLESIAFAAWVNCPPDRIPAEYKQHTCEATMIAWRRVAQAISAEVQKHWQKNARETWEAMCAMRDSINEHAPMPSVEADLLEGPEASVFCATVAEAVIRALTAPRPYMGQIMAECDCGQEVSCLTAGRCLENG